MKESRPYGKEIPTTEPPETEKVPNTLHEAVKLPKIENAIPAPIRKITYVPYLLIGQGLTLVFIAIGYKAAQGRVLEKLLKPEDQREWSERKPDILRRLRNFRKRSRGYGLKYVAVKAVNFFAVYLMIILTDHFIGVPNFSPYYMRFLSFRYQSFLFPNYALGIVIND